MGVSIAQGFRYLLWGDFGLYSPLIKSYMAKLKTLGKGFSRGQQSPEALVGYVKDERGRANGGEEFGLPHIFYLPGWGRGGDGRRTWWVCGLLYLSTAICLILRGVLLSVRARTKN